MKNTKSTIIGILTAFCLTTLTSCVKPKEEPYTLVSVMSILDKPMVNANINVFDESNNIVLTTTTDNNGQFHIPFSYGNVKVKVSGLPKGHYQDGMTSIEEKAESKTIRIKTKVIEEEAPKDTMYQINDIMYDYTFTDPNGTEYSLSKTLETKDLVLINFWATYCGPCKEEFPLLETAYRKHSDEVEVFGLSYYDTSYSVDLFKRNYGLTFPMAHDDSLYKHFDLESIPLSIIVNKYGIVSYMNSGSMSSVAEFEALFEKYKDFTYSESDNEDIPVKTEPDIPDINMPDSSEFERVVNGEGFNGTYQNETDPNDSKYNWPWIISEDGTSMRPSNSGHQSSYSTIYTSVTLDENQVFAFDYKSRCEYQADVLYVLIDRVIVAQITGVGEDFETSYCYAPITRGTHEVAFIYYKNEGVDTLEDCVYIKNLRVIPQSRIEGPVLLFRNAYDGYNPIENEYTAYITPVYNSKDGYYHVGKADGPILLANLLYTSSFAPQSIYEITGMGNVNEIDASYRNQIGKYTQMISEYSSYQNNSECEAVPVTEELKNALKDITKAVSNRGENEWLEVCGFYSAFNRDEMGDPIKGLAPFSAYEGKEGINSVNINRLLMPRGLVTSFTPTNSGVYHLYSVDYQDIYQLEVDCWLYDENYNIIDAADFGERYYMTTDKPDPNFSVYHYLEAGKTYYIRTAFANLDIFGDLVFAIEDMHVESMKVLTIASPAYFTTTMDDQGGMTSEVIAGGYDVSLESDGYYHVVLEDGTIGGILYADFLYNTGLSITYGNTPLSILDMIRYGFFNFEVDEDGNPVEGGVDKTNEISEYAEKMIDSGELEGCVPVDAKLASLLQLLMDKYTFVCDHSWTKLCYFYKVVGK